MIKFLKYWGKVLTYGSIAFVISICLELPMIIPTVVLVLVILIIK